MEEKKIEIGTVVALNSGGPDMTVVDATGDYVECIWFTTNTADGYCRGTFQKKTVTVKDYL
jgi:uncharacterized protein YodC (DUF2158 family)